MICPTVEMGQDGNYNMSLEDEKIKESFVGTLNMERGIYEDAAALYASYYRQKAFPVYSMSEEEMRPYFDIADRDVTAAFEYYWEELSDGRPLILAGVLRDHRSSALMEEYFGDHAAAG